METVDEGFLGDFKKEYRVKLDKLEWVADPATTDSGLTWQSFEEDFFSECVTTAMYLAEVEGDAEWEGTLAFGQVNGGSGAGEIIVEDENDGLDFFSATANEKPYGIKVGTIECHVVMTGWGPVI